MITLVEALNYRCLKSIRRRTDRFQVLVGPNASGKTTFLDVIAFLGDLVSMGPEHALNSRTRNFDDLLWKKTGSDFELAVELDIPKELRKEAAEPFSIVRYEVKIGKNAPGGEVGIIAEKVLMKKEARKEVALENRSFTSEVIAPLTIMTPPRKKTAKAIAIKTNAGNDTYYSEATIKGWHPAFKLGPMKSTLGNLPADEFKFPVSFWLRNILAEGVQKVVLNSIDMRKPSPPGKAKRFNPDGSNLPWVIESLKTGKPANFLNWIEHIKTALPDIEDIKTIERPEDRHRYIVIKYKGGLEVPSWMVSDGTLRLLALTLPAYLSDVRGIYLIEEPENGIHPRAIETVFQSLSSVYDAQVFIATHSPMILGIAESCNVLCFSRTENGSTYIVSGDEHPALRDWKGETNLGTLYAAGVLG